MIIMGVLKVLTSEYFGDSFREESGIESACSKRKC